MTTEENAFALSDDTVYIRALRPEEMDETIKVPPGIDRLYAVHDLSGRRIGLFDNRNTAFALARNSELSPVSVH